MEFNINIKLRVFIDDKVKFCVLPERLEEEISNIMHDWDDGRYPFNVEMVKSGAEGVILGAVEEIVVRSMYQRHGALLVPSDDGQIFTAKAVLKANELLDRIQVRLISNREEVTAVDVVVNETAIANIASDKEQG